MTLGDFIIKYIGKLVDYDKVYGSQCVDLVRQFIKDVLKVPQPESTDSSGAFTFFTNHGRRTVQNTYFDCVEVGVVGQPIPEGAIVVFKATANNRYGHIGICVRVDKNIIYLFDQDGFKQDGAKITAHGYTNALGYLQKKAVV